MKIQKTLLHVEKDSTKLEQILEHNRDWVDITFERKDSNSIKRQFTPLMCACEKGREDAVRLFLQYGANFLVENCYGNRVMCFTM